jgi:hypothetical protein
MGSRALQGEIVRVEQVARRGLYLHSSCFARSIAERDEMKLQRMFTLGVAATALFALFHLAGADAQDSQAGSHRGADIANPGVEEDSGSDATLEIAPQPGLAAPKPGAQEIPGGRNSNPGGSNAAIEPNYRAKIDNGAGDSLPPARTASVPQPRPYLGVTVQFTMQGSPGKEEHGLEVLTIDPDSPAAQAGLQARSGMTAIGAAVSTLTEILPGGPFLANKALGSSGAMGKAGDLIVAVDDRRVSGQGDLESALSRLKPGDTMYLTVIRPDRGSQKTVKIAVRVGAANEPIANAAPTGGARH